MSARTLIGAFLTIWAGTALLLSTVPRFARRPLGDRLRPYAAGGIRSAAPRRAQGGGRQFAEVLSPFAQFVGSTLSKAVGVSDDVSARLARVGREESGQLFRLRQLAIGAAAGFGTFVMVTAVSMDLAVALGAALGVAALAILIVEQRLVAASEQYQQQLNGELPVIAEQLGMLLSAGFSLSAAIGRIAQRGSGICSAELLVVTRRIRHGLSEATALREWADRADVPALGRLVEVLALNQETSDLGGMISAEARAIRREAHRELIELIERREQMVWIPVTVATLIPGVIFLAIPFIGALSTFSGA